jgi:hypothetical protein
MTTTDIAAPCERLRAALEGVTPGDLDTADHTGTGSHDCPCCEGEGTVDGKTFTNFDGFAVGVQFFGVGDEFAKYEAFFRAANPANITALLDTIEREAAEIERLRRGAGKSNDEVCQVLGKALGYPWFKNDQLNFPDATEEDGVCVGDHVAESIADEAADTIQRQAAEIERLRGALRDIQIEAEREDGRWVHLKRVIAINARAALTGEDA